MKNAAKLTFTHVGICVQDIEKSREFYRTVLGASDFFQGNYSGPGISSLVAVKNSDYNSVLLEIEGTMIELINYTAEAKDTTPVTHNQIGSTHIAFQVSNIQSLYETLIEYGVKPNSAPYTLSEKDNVDPFLYGAKFMIFRDPDGLQIETFQFNQ